MFGKKKKHMMHGMISTGATLGAGSIALDSLGAPAGAKAGLTSAAAALPAVGSIGGAGMVLKQIKKLRV